MAGDSLPRFRHGTHEDALAQDCPGEQRPLYPVYNHRETDKLTRNSTGQQGCRFRRVGGLHGHRCNSAAWIRQIGVNIRRPRLLWICSKPLTRSLVDEKSQTPGGRVRSPSLAARITRVLVPCPSSADSERNTKPVEPLIIPITHHFLRISSSHWGSFCAVC